MLCSKRMADITLDVNIRNLPCTTDEAHERGDQEQISPEVQTSGCTEINDVSNFFTDIIGGGMLNLLHCLRLRHYFLMESIWRES